MADLGEENKVTGVFGGVELGEQQENAENITGGTGVFGGVGFDGETEPVKSEAQIGQGINENNLPTKRGFWAKFKAFWLQDIDWGKVIKVELTPYQQKVEDEINEFLHQEVSWKRITNFFKGKKNN